MKFLKTTYMNNLEALNKEARTGQNITYRLLKEAGIPTSIKSLSSLHWMLRVLGSRYSFFKDTIWLAPTVWELAGAKNTATVAREVGHALQKHRNYSVLGLDINKTAWINRLHYPVFYSWACCFLLLIWVPSQILGVISASLLFACILMRLFIDRIITDASKVGLQCLFAKDPTRDVSVLDWLGLDKSRIIFHLKRHLRPYRINHVLLLVALIENVLIISVAL